jgi:hypothetical protein
MQEALRVRLEALLAWSLSRELLTKPTYHYETN